METNSILLEPADEAKLIILRFNNALTYKCLLTLLEFRDANQYHLRPTTTIIKEKLNWSGINRAIYNTGPNSDALTRKLITDSLMYLAKEAFNSGYWKFIDQDKYLHQRDISIYLSQEESPKQKNDVINIRKSLRLINDGKSLEGADVANVKPEKIEFKYLIITQVMMRQTLLILLITYVLAKGGGSRGGRSRGGRSSGFGGGGSSKSPTVRGSIHNSQSGYRRHHYIYYYAIIANSHTHRNGYLYSNDPAQIDGEAPFDCGNGKIIRENQVCDWIDDCGNGVDERVPLPCEGKPSQQELNLYFAMTTIYFIWIFILSYLLYGENSHDKHHEEDHGYDVLIIFKHIILYKYNISHCSSCK